MSRDELVEKVAVAIEREFPECIDEGRMGFILRLARAAIEAASITERSEPERDEDAGWKDPQPLCPHGLHGARKDVKGRIYCTGCGGTMPFEFDALGNAAEAERLTKPSANVEGLREALERIGKRKLGGPWKPGQVAGERREMIELARAALEMKG